MPWTCRVIPHRTRVSAKYSPVAGDMGYRVTLRSWRAAVREWREKGADRDAPLVRGLSDEYLAQRIDQRPPLTVYLPGCGWFCVDSAPSNGDRSGWNVTGTPPAITVSPSINCEGHYHGWLRDGVITDDCEGRRYIADGTERVNA